MSEFTTVVLHGDYTLNAVVKSDSKTVDLIVVGKTIDGVLFVVEPTEFPLLSFDMQMPTKTVEVFRAEFTRWLGAGGEKKLDDFLAGAEVSESVPILPVVIEAEEEPAEEVKVEAEVKVEEKPKPKAKAKPKPKSE